MADQPTTSFGTNGLATAEMSGVEPGESQVDEFTIDGDTVSGTATFVELNETFAHSGGGAKAQPVTGTFEVSCPG